MSDYGADPDPDIDKINTVCFGYNLGPQGDVKVDQFSTDGDDKVYSLVQKLGSSRLLVRVNPAEIAS